LLKKEFVRAKAYADEYLGGNPQAHAFRARIGKVAELLADFGQGRVLDIGCGPAIVGTIFRGKPIEYVGVDISEAMIGLGRESFGNLPRFAFSIQGIESLGFADASFDVVLCLGVLEYVVDERAAMREVTRVLKPGGVLIVTMINKESLYELWEGYVRGRLTNAMRRLGRLLGVHRDSRRGMKETAPERPITRVLRQKTLRKLLTSAGLCIERTIYYDFRIILPPMDSFFPRFSAFMSRNLESCCRNRLRFLGRGFLLKCRRNASAGDGVLRP